MKITVSESVPLSAEDVFRLLRDDMPSLVPFLHDIERIDVTERIDTDDTVRIVNLWQGDMSRVPAAVRRFVSPELISWKDHALWTNATRSATWRLEPRIGARVFTCTGTTRLVERVAESALLEMDIDFEVYPERVPGVPSLLARRFHQPIEDAIASQIRPNLENLAVSIRAYAKAKAT